MHLIGELLTPSLEMQHADHFLEKASTMWQGEEDWGKTLSWHKPKKQIANVDYFLYSVGDVIVKSGE